MLSEHRCDQSAYQGWPWSYATKWDTRRLRDADRLHLTETDGHTDSSNSNNHNQMDLNQLSNLIPHLRPHFMTKDTPRSQGDELAAVLLARRQTSIICYAYQLRANCAVTPLGARAVCAANLHRDRSSSFSAWLIQSEHFHS